MTTLLVANLAVKLYSEFNCNNEKYCSALNYKRTHLTLFNFYF